MKRTFFVLILLLSICMIKAITIYVNGNNTNGPWDGSLLYPFQEIQDAVDAASHRDNIQVFSFNSGHGEYEGFSFNGKDLDIYSIGSPVPQINGDLTSPSLSVIVDMTDIENPNTSQFATPSLKGFEIYGSDSAIGVKLTDLSGSYAEMERLEIRSVDKAIYLNENQNAIKISYNTLHNNSFGLYSLETYPNSGNNDNLTNCTIYDNTYGLFLLTYSNTNAYQCLFYDNDYSAYLNSTSPTLIMESSTVSNSTALNSDTGIYAASGSSFTAKNCIIYGSSDDINDNGCLISVTYSDIGETFTGTGNINADPHFCMETGYKFHIMEGSPCIDTGDSNTTGGDVRIDMGCFETTTDVKECEGQHWNWVSYPRLNRLNNGPVDATTTLTEFLDWPFHLEMLHNVIFWVDPTLEFENSTWAPISYNVQSSLGYKLNPDETGDHYLPTLANATRLSATWTLDYLAADDNWLGYWLPYTQNIEDAFGTFFQYVVSVEAEDWYYEFSKVETPSSSTTNKNMVYGKGYIITFDRDISDFGWTDATSRGSRDGGSTHPDPQYFCYNDLPNYEAIDVMNIPANVVEIGVFEDDVCVGAVVVQDSCEQILAYTTPANRNSTPLTFQYITNERGGALPVTDYSVLNKKTGIYEKRPLISGMQKSSVIRFEDLPTTQPGTPAVHQPQLHGNYPNPFNPVTTISFSLPQPQRAELLIYNTRGQLVRTLLKGDLSAGEHTAVWNGTDDTGNAAGSGIYFYRLVTETQILSEKMVLLK